MEAVLLDALNVHPIQLVRDAGRHISNKKIKLVLFVVKSTPTVWGIVLVLQ